MGIGTRIQRLRINNGLTQEKLAEMLNVSRQSVSKWEMEQSMPEVDKIVLMSRLFGVGTNEILLEAADLKKLRPQEIHLGSVYLIARDFEKSIAFYEKLLSMTVSTRNCGNKFAEFFFDNKCLAIMNEANLPGHHYVDGDHKFVLNFWVEDLKREHIRLKELMKELSEAVDKGDAEEEHRIDVEIRDVMTMRKEIARDMGERTLSTP